MNVCKLLTLLLSTDVFIRGVPLKKMSQDDFCAPPAKKSKQEQERKGDWCDFCKNSFIPFINLINQMFCLVFISPSLCEEGVWWSVRCLDAASTDPQSSDGGSKYQPAAQTVKQSYPVEKWSFFSFNLM